MKEGLLFPITINLKNIIILKREGGVTIEKKISIFHLRIKKRLNVTLDARHIPSYLYQHSALSM